MAEAFGELVVAMEAEPFRDLLGPIYMDLSPNTFSGEFYTPRDVCRMMAQMIVGNGELPEERPIRILEPAIGAGAMVLAAAEAFHARGVLPTELYVEGWDVSRTAVHMSYVNATLSSLPAKVILGNTLSGEVRKVWRTIHLPVYRSAETSSEEPEGRQNENRPVLPPPQLSLEL